MSTVGEGRAIRVLVLSKRQYMSRDLLDDRYGRFRELPLALASQGMEVKGLCLSYRNRPEGDTKDEDERGHVSWLSLNVRRLLPVTDLSYWRQIDRIGTNFRPDVVWACSDIPHAVLGALAARRMNSKLVIDLYDNFESYVLSRIPGVDASLRRSIRLANGVTCVSTPLSCKVREQYGYGGMIQTIENAIPNGVFRPADKSLSRKQFNLPTDGILIGTAGALSPGRGTEYLIRAFQLLAEERADVHLVLAGTLDPELRIPESGRIHFLGLLEADQVPKLLPALDVSVITNKNSEFGKYCFPQKLYESLACKLPVAVARVGAMAELLRQFPENLYEVDDVGSLLNALRRLSDEPRFPSIEVPSWDSLGRRLHDFLYTVVRKPASLS